MRFCQKRRRPTCRSRALELKRPIEKSVFTKLGSVGEFWPGRKTRPLFCGDERKIWECRSPAPKQVFAATATQQKILGRRPMNFWRNWVRLRPEVVEPVRVAWPGVFLFISRLLVEHYGKADLARK